MPDFATVYRRALADPAYAEELRRHYAKTSPPSRRPAAISLVRLEKENHTMTTALQKCRAALARGEPLDDPAEIEDAILELAGVGDDADVAKLGDDGIDPDIADARKVSKALASREGALLYAHHYFARRASAEA